MKIPIIGGIADGCFVERTGTVEDVMCWPVYTGKEGQIKHYNYLRTELVMGRAGVQVFIWEDTMPAEALTLLTERYINT